MTFDHTSVLAQGLGTLRLDLTAVQRQRLLDYMALLIKWNRVYNLTTIRASPDIATHHVLDSLAVWPYVRAPRVLDVGSGAGLPGIPLAIALPDLNFTLLDSTAKKIRFLIQAINELRLANASVVHDRIEHYHPAEPYDTVISRAFSRLRVFISCAGRLCQSEGLLLAMKGRYPADELSTIPSAYKVEDVVRLAVPHLHKERHLVRIRHVVTYHAAMINDESPSGTGTST